MAKFNRIVGGKESIRQMLLSAGVGEFNATMSIPYMYFMPRACDPYTQGVMQIVEGLQNLLNARGAKLQMDGWMGEPTVREVMRYSGPQWANKTWVQIYGDVLRGRPAVQVTRPLDVSGIMYETGLEPTAGPLEMVSDLMASPLAWLAAGGLAYHFLAKKRASSPRSTSKLGSSSYKRIRL